MIWRKYFRIPLFLKSKKTKNVDRDIEILIFRMPYRDVAKMSQKILILSKINKN